MRAQFPAFSEETLQGQAFFENAGGSYTCAPVIDRLTRFYRQRKVQPYAPYEASRLGGEEMDEARRRLSALLGVTGEELSFGPIGERIFFWPFQRYLQIGASSISTCILINGFGLKKRESMRVAETENSSSFFLLFVSAHETV